MGEYDLIRRGDALNVTAQIEGIGDCKMPMRWQEMIEALPAAPVSVKVKQLEWTDNYARYASNPWGGYSIVSRCGPDASWEWSGWRQSSRGDIDESDDDYQTVSEAKAAAQADYETRILSALDVTPITLADAPAGSGMIDVEQSFLQDVAAALKADATDLGKEARILDAFRKSFAALKSVGGAE